MADSKLSALSEISVPALEDLLYTVDDPSGTPVSNKVTGTRYGGMLLNHLCQGRLTLETGVPVSTSDQTAKTSVYFTPFNGNKIAIYDGTRWKLYAFTELTLALGTLADATNYDVFVYDNAGTLTLELSAAWTNNTTPSDTLTTQDGVPVKSGATTRRHLGTIRTTSTTTTEDSAGGSTSNVGGKRFVWNRYNQVPRVMLHKDTTDAWQYQTSTIRQARAQSGAKLEYVTGDPSTRARAVYWSTVALATNSTVRARVGVGLDTTTAFSGWSQAGFSGVGAGVYIISALSGGYTGYPGVGYHYLAALESGADGTDCQFTGDNGGDSQTMLEGEIWG